jgi:alpha,alpha-trehalase
MVINMRITTQQGVSMNAKVSIPEEALQITYDYIQTRWPALTRTGASLAFPLPGRFIIPGGFFKWFFYWDSYFTLTGLVVQEDWQLAREIVDNLVCEVEHFGFVPNYNGPNGVCASRSQSPFLTAAICEVYPYVQEREWLERATRAAVKEYEGYWLSEPHLTSTGLSRYHDLGGTGCGTVPDTPHYRAIAESGWDNTPRFGDDATEVVPVDLNSQLYRYERDIARFYGQLERHPEAAIWEERAVQRRMLIDSYLWDSEGGIYRDYDLRTGQALQSVPRSLASFVPLWAGVASQQQAQQMQAHLPLFEHAHGLANCEPGWDDETEHNYPTGWAYSHWYVCYGLRRYGFHDDASRIALKWLRLNAARFVETGHLWERYNVVQQDAPLSGRYRPLKGFAWTNGVFAALLVRIVFGQEYDPFTRQRLWDAALPPEWQEQFT